MKRPRALLLGLGLGLGLALAACGPVPVGDMPSRAVIADSTLPPMKRFSRARPTPPERSNHEIARDFLDLSFALENGRSLPRLTRFEQPITVRVTGRAPRSLRSDLTALIARLRDEARIDIREVSGTSANITIEAVTGSQIRQSLPQAACFVVPNVTSLADFRSARRASRTNWSLLEKRERLAIFVPADSSPQETRDCLQEELAQAIGPLNDLYRLPDSVFNDDNMHAVLTGFDMLILRTYYDPALQNGMTRDQVAARLPAILARLNPAGEGRGSDPLPATPRAWIDAVQTALGPDVSNAQRRSAAARALRIAEQTNLRDHRRGFSHYILGRLLQSHDADRAHTEFALADHYFTRARATGPHRAFVATQLAAYELSSGRGKDAIDRLTPHLPQAARYENAALLATLMLLNAEALELAGRASEARSVRLDSLGWARYGFGADWAVRAKQHEISGLSPLKRGF
ncbi:Protein of unknown function [Salinihabitans flavidus]|uniref:ATP-dependent transcriptional regulator n=1 Tax=Salinihabitans flavidus TaxID=569882 RepID=A0A1H8QGF7_9RHOB|nr:DUF2927 domain-containing protein [Salinihabitans flavidus]SEO53128.1 Protein of unknown function [Salinihabitans flavidus]